MLPGAVPARHGSQKQRVLCTNGPRLLRGQRAEASVIAAEGGSVFLLCLSLHLISYPHIRPGHLTGARSSVPAKRRQCSGASRNAFASSEASRLPGVLPMVLPSRAPGVSPYWPNYRRFFSPTLQSIPKMGSMFSLNFRGAVLFSIFLPGRARAFCDSRRAAAHWCSHPGRSRGQWPGRSWAGA